MLTVFNNLETNKNTADQIFPKNSDRYSINEFVAYYAALMNYSTSSAVLDLQNKLGSEGDKCVVYISHPNLTVRNLNQNGQLLFSVKTPTMDHIAFMIPNYMLKHFKYAWEHAEHHEWNPKGGMDQKRSYLNIDLNLRDK